MTMKKGKREAEKPLVNTTKKIVWFCIVNGVAWVWCSYFLAYMGREKIAESLSEKAVAQIVGVALVYCIKALLEKRPEFGSVGKHRVKENDDEIQRDL